MITKVSTLSHDSKRENIDEQMDIDGQMDNVFPVLPTVYNKSNNHQTIKQRFYQKCYNGTRKQWRLSTMLNEH